MNRARGAKTSGSGMATVISSIATPMAIILAHNMNTVNSN
jgi:hypothetical protein